MNIDARFRSTLPAFFLAVLSVSAPVAVHAADDSTDMAWISKIRLGQKLFFDTNLSTPPGQSCATCHDAKLRFTDPDKDVPTSNGVLPELKGSRNTPTAMYAAYSPKFHFDAEEGLYVGGQFLDGRAENLKEQAKGPFVNPLEMANPNQAAVVRKVRKARYARLFRRVYGQHSLDNVGQAYDRIADAIAAFEETPVFARFTSKYDYVLKGRAKLTPQERRGRRIFEDPDKGNCAACHPSRPAEDGMPPLFTDFTYDNLGTPRNPQNPFYTLPPDRNPDGFAFVDLGLGGALGDPAENGKFKVSTLRNIAKTGPYGHNGYFKSLRGIVDFYNTRDIKPRCSDPFTPEEQALALGCWPEPEVAENVNRSELGSLGLAEREVDDLVAFLRTLSDGWQPDP